jgi:hypothetical protein
MVAQFLNNEEIDRDPTHVLQHRLVQRQFCDQTPQAHILLLHLPQLTNLVYSQANQPNVVSSSDKSSAPRSLPGESTRHRNPHLGFLQDGYDLLHRMTLPLHGNSPFLDALIVPETHSAVGLEIPKPVTMAR